ncbi:MAG: N-acetylmuramoyl-L-alanine amidase [Ignavibacteriales bacterium]|nr:N-acetylmuramoyl-L-alanine amidase [Ignavibacteriales bacterium]
MRKILMNAFALSLLLLFLSHCSAVPLFEYPPDWKEAAKRDSVVKYYSKFLSGKKIFLDAGHGGEDRKNKNQDGNVVEADVNLKVVQNLRNYLNAAGVETILSRDEDKTVPLAYRSELANKSGADLFISIHHNAPAKWEDNYTNYTSTYYHAKETDYEYEPCERDLAKYIQRDLSYVMGNPGGLGSFDGTYSDYIIYPGEGFSVLRKTEMPSVLVECAFHTNRLEELRLNDSEFNQIQAWGIFRGIGKYFRSGIPQIELISDSTKFENNLLKLSFALIDSNGINTKLLQFFFNKEEKNFSFDKTTNILSVEIENSNEGEYPVRVICANKNGNHSLPYHKKLFVNNSGYFLLKD